MLTALRFEVVGEISAIGQFATGDRAARARVRLIHEGFSDDQIAILLPDYELRSTNFVLSIAHDVRPAAVLGIVTGSLLGLVVAMLVFIIPEVAVEGDQTFFVILGTIFCVLLAGIAGALTGIRLSQKLARRFFEDVGTRGILLQVQADDNEALEMARRSMVRSGSNWVALTTENPKWRQIPSHWETIDLKTFRQIRRAAN